MNAQAAVLPEWLTAGPGDPPPVSLRSYHDTVFSILFEKLIDEITVGRSLKSILDADVRDIDRAAFLRWIKRDTERTRRFREAQELYAEVRFSEIPDIAENAPDSKTADSQIGAIKIVASAYDRKRFGERKEIDISHSLDLRGAMADARARALTIEGTCELIEDNSEDRE